MNITLRYRHNVIKHITQTKQNPFATGLGIAFHFVNSQSLVNTMSNATDCLNHFLVQCIDMLIC